MYSVKNKIKNVLLNFLFGQAELAYLAHKDEVKECVLVEPGVIVEGAGLCTPQD